MPQQKWTVSYEVNGKPHSLDVEAPDAESAKSVCMQRLGRMFAPLAANLRAAQKAD